MLMAHDVMSAFSLCARVLTALSINVPAER